MGVVFIRMRRRGTFRIVHQTFFGSDPHIKPAFDHECSQVRKPAVYRPWLFSIALVSRFGSSRDRIPLRMSTKPKTYFRQMRRPYV